MIKDVALTRINGNTYDWIFDAYDLRVLNGNQRLASAVTHAVMLKPQEMRVEPYNTRGCEAHNYIKGRNDELNRVNIEESIKVSCKEIIGVEDASVTLSEENRNTVNITELHITTSNGDEMVVQ